MNVGGTVRCTFEVNEYLPQDHLHKLKRAITFSRRVRIHVYSTDSCTGLRIRSSRYSSVKDEVSGTINTYTMIRLWTGGVILVVVTICYVISSDSVRSRVKSRATVGSSIALNRGRMFFKIDHTIICNYKYRG